MEIIKSLRNIEFDTLFIAFKEAFKDYEMQLSKNGLHTMLHRRGFVPELSFGAFENDKLVSFTFNGIGSYNNLKTAYDTGTGTIEKYRGQGLATRIFEYSLPFLKEINVKRYLLEVLQHNTKAVSVYEKLGFKISREFNYFIQKTKCINTDKRPLSQDFHIQTVESLKKVSTYDFCDFTPSWQNSINAIKRNLDDFKILCTFKGRVLVGYCILEPKSGDITQIAVSKSYRRKGVGSFMFNEILQYNQLQSVKIINAQADCKSIVEFLGSKEIALTGKQFEMIKNL